MLSDDEKSRVRAEEEFRAEIRKELEARKGPPGLGTRVWTFLNSQFGGWLLGTVVIGSAGIGFTTYVNWRNADAINRQEIRARAREDGQTVSALLTHLGSDRPAVAAGAAALLTDLSRRNGIDPSLAASLEVVISTYQRTAAGSNTTEAQRAGAEASVAVQDARSTPALEDPDSPGNGSAGECRQTEALTERRNSDPSFATSPRRVYLHIADESQRGAALNLASRLREEGYLVPGVENVGRNSPGQTEVRFFNSEDADFAEDVFEIAAAANVPSLASPKCPPLYARLGHVEVFFARL